MIRNPKALKNHLKKNKASGTLGVGAVAEENTNAKFQVDMITTQLLRKSHI